MEKNYKQPQTTSKDLLKVVFFGPESTGKTIVSQDLATHFNTSWAAEYMREYLQKKWDDSKESCTIDDLIPIAKGQMKNEAYAEKNANKIVFYDTNLLQLKVYSEVYYNGYCPPEIEKEVLNHSYDFYFLMYIDTPWEADALRDKPNERGLMFQRFKDELDAQKLPYKIIQGSYIEKRISITKTIEKLLQLKANKQY